VVVSSTFPQPFVLAPDGKGGILLGRYRWGGPADGGASVYHLRWNVVQQRVDTLAVDTLMAPLVFSLVEDGVGGYVAWLYNGGASGRFSLVHRDPLGSYRVLTEATELFRVSYRAGMVRLDSLLLTGSHLQGVLVHDTLGRLIQVVGPASGLADAQVLDLQASSDTVWVLTRHAVQRLLSQGSGFRIAGTFHAAPGESLQSLAISRSGLFVLSSRALIQLDPVGLKVLDRWLLGRDLPGHLWISTERLAVHRSLVYDAWHDAFWINTTAGLIRFSPVTISTDQAVSYQVFPNPLRGNVLFLRGPQPERWWVLDPLGQPVLVRSVRSTVYGLRFELDAAHRGRGVYRLVLERQGRHWRIPFTWIP
jgi:hypothetical protein